jgi:hypothetical protein
MILALFSKSEGIFVISASKLAMRPKIRAQLSVFQVADKPDKVAGNLTMRFFTFKRLYLCTRLCDFGVLGLVGKLFSWRVR